MFDVALLFAACAALALGAGSTTVLLRPDSALDAAVTFGVIASAGVVVAGLACGEAGVLTPAAVLAVTAGWALVATAAVARTGWRPRRPRLGPPALREHLWATAIVAVAGLALAWQLVVALVLPPFAFDAITYHLTIVASWVRSESIEPTALSLCCAYYPANSELVFAWPVLFLGSDGLVDTVQFGFVALAAVSVAGIARSAGLARPAAAAAAGLFVATPVVLLQAPTNFADVMIAAWALAALHSLTRLAATGAAQRLLVAGLAAGLLLGTKGTGIVWAAALALAAVGVGLWGVRRARVSRRALAAGLAGFAVACLAVGSYWHVRNWIETGNPAYPFEVRAAGVKLFDGPFRVDDVLTRPDAGDDEPWPAATLRSWASDLDFWNQRSYDYQQRSGGLGPLWPWLALPLAIPFVVGLARRRSPALVAVATIALVTLVQPYGWWSRFTIPLMGAGAVAIVAAATWAPRPWMRRAVQGLALFLACAGIGLASYRVNPASRAEPLPARDLLGLIGAPGEERTLGRLFFPEYRFLEDVPDDAVVVVDLRARPVRFVYPLFGPEQSRDVRPLRGGRVPPGEWVVTAAGRPVERALAADSRFELAAASRGVRVWRRRPPGR
ncbi:MAG TPA: hypothetical protein VNB64_12905 [Solirubrobacteraceae bacterium]|nr:hypothetical protein [Solirubrobacteraceae bacterium]